MPRRTTTTTAQQEVAGQSPTDDDSLIAPNSEPLERQSPDVEEQRLEAYLRESFPQEFTRTNRQVPESPVSMAIRLLTGLHAHVATGAPDLRCETTFCNKPRNHADAHGWVHFG